jgi:hypothetical protein
MFKFIFSLILLVCSLGAAQASTIVRVHENRNSFLLAHETLVSELEYGKLTFELAKEGSIKKRRILCFKIPSTLKQLYTINTLNKKWQTDSELKKSEKHLKLLVKKRNEILLSNHCQGS